MVTYGHGAGVCEIPPPVEAVDTSPVLHTFFRFGDTWQVWAQATHPTRCTCACDVGKEMPIVPSNMVVSQSHSSARCASVSSARAQARGSRRLIVPDEVPASCGE